MTREFYPDKFPLQGNISEQVIACRKVLQLPQSIFH